MLHSTPWVYTYSHRHLMTTQAPGSHNPQESSRVTGKLHFFTNACGSFGVKKVISRLSNGPWPALAGFDLTTSVNPLDPPPTPTLRGLGSRAELNIPGGSKSMHLFPWHFPAQVLPCLLTPMGSVLDD